MNAHIVFAANDRRPQFSIRRITECEITSGWGSLTDTARIVLPRNIRNLERKAVGNYFRRGDRVDIYMGYNGQLRHEFGGYLSKVKANIPIELNCEDMMYRLKQTPCNISLAPGKLLSFLQQVVPGDITIDAANVEIGAVKFTNVSVAKALEKLKDDFGLYSYFKGYTLVVGKTYLDDSAEVKLQFERNIKPDTDLEYQVADDLRLQVKATSLLKGGKKLEVTVGDEDGETSTLTYAGITSEAELRKLANADLQRLKVDGYKGELSLWGIPAVAHGYMANLIDTRYPDRAGKYYIKAVTKSFGSNGYSQTATLERRAS